MSVIAGHIGKTDKQQYWDEIYIKIKLAVNLYLWDDQDGFYYDRLVETNSFKKIKAVSSFLPLFAGICDQVKAERLVEHLKDPSSFFSEFPIPSISLDHTDFGTDMWRGPTWINFNYMLILGLKQYGYIELAGEIKRKTINIMAHWYENDGVIYEFYDSRDRISPHRINRKGKNVQPYDFRVKMQSIRDYGWSCTLYVDMCLGKCEIGF